MYVFEISTKSTLSSGKLAPSSTFLLSLPAACTNTTSLSDAYLIASLTHTGCGENDLPKLPFITFAPLSTA